MKLLKKLFFPTVASLLAISGIAYASTAVPPAPAIFQTVLSSPMGTSDSTMFLQSTTLVNGGSLTGYQCFTVSPQSTNTEYICGTISGNTVTGLQRGLDPVTATTTDATLTFTHRRGDAVQITTFPSLQRLSNIANGIDVFPTPVLYDSGISTSTIATNRNNLASVGLLDDTAFAGAGVINATLAAKGVVQLATGAQAAASTATGSSGASLALSTSIATSTFNSATAGNVIPVTNGSGKIDSNFIATTTLFTNATFATTTQIGSFPAYQLWMQRQVITSTGTSTFSIPSGITKLYVQVQAGGGAGGGTAGSGSGAGGGGGGYAAGIVDVTGTTTVQVFIGSGGTGTTGAGPAGTWSTFGTNGFYMSANPGLGSASGAGGTALGGDLDITGGIGGNGGGSAAAGQGGGSQLGRGGPAMFGSNIGSNSGTGYGGGGSGCVSSGSGCSGGNGTQGIVLIQW